MPNNEKENKDIKDLLEHLEIAKHPHSCHTIALDAHRYHHALTELIEKLEMLEYHNEKLMDVNAALHRRLNQAGLDPCSYLDTREKAALEAWMRNITVIVCTDENVTSNAKDLLTKSMQNAIYAMLRTG